MEYTSSTSLHFPAAYAPISEDEMIYIEGGADVISPQQFTYNLVTNLIRLMGQAAFTSAVTGLINMRNDGLTVGGSIKHYWGRQTPVGKAATVLRFCRLCGLHLCRPARQQCAEHLHRREGQLLQRWFFHRHHHDRPHRSLHGRADGGLSLCLTTRL